MSDLKIGDTITFGKESIVIEAITATGTNGFKYTGLSSVTGKQTDITIYTMNPGDITYRSNEERKSSQWTQIFPWLKDE